MFHSSLFIWFSTLFIVTTRLAAILADYLRTAKMRILPIPHFKLNHISFTVGPFILLSKNRRGSTFSLRARANELSGALPPTTVIPNYGCHDIFARLFSNLECSFFYGDIVLFLAAYTYRYMKKYRFITITQT